MAYEVVVSGASLDTVLPLARALRPAARLALLVWRAREDNPWFREVTGALTAERALPAPPSDAPSPFALGDPDRVRVLLTGAGFRDVELEALDEPMWFGADVDHAHAFLVGLLGWMLDGLEFTARVRALDQLRGVLTAHFGRGGVQLDSGAWLITATRFREGSA
jgi:hypothetical protein